jgi:hypothetical protein
MDRPGWSSHYDYRKLFFTAAHARHGLSLGRFGLLYLYVHCLLYTGAKTLPDSVQDFTYTNMACRRIDFLRCHGIDEEYDRGKYMGQPGNQLFDTISFYFPGAAF